MPQDLLQGTILRELARFCEKRRDTCQWSAAFLQDVRHFQAQGIQRHINPA